VLALAILLPPRRSDRNRRGEHESCTGTRERILTLRPDVVVLELDATHLATVIDAELNEALTCCRTTTLVDALGIVFSGRFDMFLYDLT
jgi:hypothetical protein